MGGVAQRLMGLGRPPIVVVITGAGISTNAGIKDFRSSDGLYAQNRGAAAFSMELLMQRPSEFYDTVREQFLPVVDRTIGPTSTHALLRLLHEAGWLRRVYTQNVDMLEEMILPPDKVTTCHGSFRRALCTSPDCSFTVSMDMDMDTVSSTSLMEEVFWGPIRQHQVPVCPLCRSILRPDVTFFGEPLSADFTRLSNVDLRECDLLLVLGTSLMVHPVASLPQMVGPQAVRMLVNREARGCFQFVSPCNDLPNKEGTIGSDTEVIKEDQWMTSAYRDVFFQGDCDHGAEKLAFELGRVDEWIEIHNKHCTSLAHQS